MSLGGLEQGFGNWTISKRMPTLMAKRKCWDYNEGEWLSKRGRPKVNIWETNFLDLLDESARASVTVYHRVNGFSQFSSVQSLSRVRLFVTPWIAAHQASLSITNSQSSLKLTSIESVMPSSHLILCCPLLFLPSITPSIRVFSMSQLFSWGGQSIGVSA